MLVQPTARIPRAQHRRPVDIIRSPTFKEILGRPRVALLRSSNRKSLAKLEIPARLHLGCGLNSFAGWTNIDSNRASDANLLLDVRGGLPMEPGSIGFAYSEHMIEHMPRRSAAVWLKDLRVGLADDGVVRIATPDLRHIVSMYLSDWRDQAWIKSDPKCTIATGCEMLNVALRSWGHAYVYDFEDLERLLVECGFGTVKRVEWGQSSHSELEGRETRLDSTLIVEASH